MYMTEVVGSRKKGGHRSRDRMVVEFITTLQSVPITTNVASSNLVRARCTR